MTEIAQAFDLTDDEADAGQLIEAVQRANSPDGLARLLAQCIATAIMYSETRRVALEERVADLEETVATLTAQQEAPDRIH